MRWISIQSSLPPNGEVVETKIDDGIRITNVQNLKRNNMLWFLPDSSIYVYYTPTHWRKLK